MVPFPIQILSMCFRLFVHKNKIKIQSSVPNWIIKLVCQLIPKMKEQIFKSRLNEIFVLLILSHIVLNQQPIIQRGKKATDSNESHWKNPWYFENSNVNKPHNKRNGRHWLHPFEHFYKMNQSQISTLEVYWPTKRCLGIL